jgi:hypothetical protein
MTYNATVYRYRDGAYYSTFVAEVGAGGVLLRSNAVQCTGREGSAEYDAYVRGVAFAGDVLCVVADGGEGYRAALRGVALPPAYTG